MQVSGWVFISISWIVILGLTFFCFLRIFSKNGLSRV